MNIRLRKLIVLLFPLLLLQACVPAIIAGAAAGGMIIDDQRSMKKILADNGLAQRIRKKLSENPAIKEKSHVVVSVFNGIVLLAGQTPNYAMRNQIDTILSSVSGIRRVYNQITIQKPISDKQRAKDTWITTKAKTAMLAKQGLHSTQIKIITENGTLFLMGLVKPQQAALATQLARRVPDVVRVVRLFEYLKK